MEDQGDSSLMPRWDSKVGYIYSRVLRKKLSLGIRLLMDICLLGLACPRLLRTAAGLDSKKRASPLVSGLRWEILNRCAGLKVKSS